LSPTDWQAYDHYVYAAIAAVGTLVAVVAVHWFMARSRWSDWVRSLEGVGAPFINVVGILFGLTLAFLANDTWTAHDRAINAVLREADSIRTLAILSRLLNQPAGDELRAAITDYAQATVAEWPLLARGQTDPRVRRVGDRLLSIVARVRSARPPEPRSNRRCLRRRSG
jgi:hypothetical protein